MRGLRFHYVVLHTIQFRRADALQLARCAYEYKEADTRELNHMLNVLVEMADAMKAGDETISVTATAQDLALWAKICLASSIEEEKKLGHWLEKSRAMIMFETMRINRLTAPEMTAAELGGLAEVLDTLENELYSLPEGSVGGPAHVVLDDYNVDDASLQFVLEYMNVVDNSEKPESPTVNLLVRAIVDGLRMLTMAQRFVWVRGLLPCEKEQGEFLLKIRDWKIVPHDNGGFLVSPDGKNHKYSDEELPKPEDWPHA